MKKKITVIAMVLAVLMVFRMLPTIAHAQTTDVTTFDEFKQAVQNASYGDTIIVSGVIVVNSECNIGSNSQAVTIERSGSGRIQVESTAVFRNLVFDGKGISADSPFIDVNASASFYDCTFKNCNSGAIAFGDYGATVERCTFLDNSAVNGGHIMIKAGMGMNLLYITNSTFTGGHAVNGGAIYIAENGLGVMMQGCTFTKNSATAQGGAIWNCGSLDIDDMSMIYGNTASNGSDIYNHDALINLGGSFQNTSAHFASEGITIHGWINEATGQDVSVPSMVNPRIPLKMVFEVSSTTGGEQQETEPTQPPTEEGSEGQEGSDQGEGTEDEKKDDTGSGSETEAPEGNETDPDDQEEGESKGEEQDDPTKEEPDSGDDSGTQEEPSDNTDQGTDAPEQGDPVTPSEDQTQSETPASETDVNVDVNTNIDNTQGNQTIDNNQNITIDNGSGDSVQNIPVTITVEAGQPQQTVQTVEGETVNVNVSGQPVTLPDASGVTVNVQVDNIIELPESSQAVTSEGITKVSDPSVIMTVSEPTQTEADTHSGVDVVQIIQTVLLACILGFLIGDRKSKKKDS